ncbi:MAG: DUF885 domain-containing protein [Gammaproteobacteria bacterium]|nr:DUF885 domain-containing protein [Gammaproteobacteria bacterium]
MKHLFLILLLVPIVLACSDDNGKPPSGDGQQTAAVTEHVMTPDEAKTLSQQIYEQYFEEFKQLNPVFATFLGEKSFNHLFSDPINAESIAKQTAFNQKYLGKINKISPDLLSGQDRLSLEVFKRDREIALQGDRFPDYLMPLNQMFGVHNFFAQLGSGKSAQPFDTLEDYDNFIQRSKGFVKWMDSSIVSMREGIERGVVQPDVVMKKVIPQLAYHIVENVEDSIFASPLKNIPESIQGEERHLLEERYSAMIEEQLIPAYQRVHSFISDEYLAKARKTVGYSELPDGKAWYEYNIRTNTTLDLTAEEVHQLGKNEVARILEEMKNVKQTVGFEGDLAAFFIHLKTDDKFYFNSEDELVAGYEATRDKINKLTPKLFSIFPKADYEVRLIESFRAASSAGAEYQAPSPDGTRPGVFYINSYNLKAQPKFLMETLSIHEASPGHHFQTTIQQEITGLPLFRRFGSYTVYSEGWALYAESLGKELGLFTDPMMWYGRLVDEQLRAMRLVLDTGLHALGWTREQAIQYMLDNSSMSESDVTAEVERYIAIPGQALGYKIGQFKIRELRELSEKVLGNKFDIKEFHTQILVDGALPMPILEAKIKRWIKTVKST